MQEISVPVGTIQYLYEKAGLPPQESAEDPTAGTVQMAVASAGQTPASGDWKDGEWFTDSFGKPWARVLLGSTIPLSSGIFDVWIRTSLDGETPARPCARLYVA